MEGRIENNSEVEKQKFLGEINDLLNDWSNEIPDTVLHGPPPAPGGKNYKVQTRWFTSIVNLLQYLEHKKYLPESIDSEIVTLIKAFHARRDAIGEGYDRQKTTTKEEIDAWDDLLKKALKEFK